MPLTLTQFPIRVTRDHRVSFHDGFLDPRPHDLVHEAVDIAAAEGTDVCSSVAGIVVRSWLTGRGRVPGVGWSDRGGNVVLIFDHAGYAHYYAHMLRPPRLSPGQRVGAGEFLGQVSNSGSIARGSAKHLHYQVWTVGAGREAELATGVFDRRFGRAVNPYSELARLAGGLGAHIGANGSVVFTTAAEDEAAAARRARRHSRTRHA
ncbi:MAG: M23 family metallopeptidase [Burkholderiales bacterium]|nr:M23 family metallopeptidase [Burkholderiales bacterium]